MNLLIKLFLCTALTLIFVNTAFAEPRGACVTGTYTLHPKKISRQCRDNVKNTFSACKSGLNASFFAGKSCRSLGFVVKCSNDTKTKTKKACRHNKHLVKLVESGLY